MENFKKYFDDNDIQFEFESKNKDGHYLSVYTIDCKDIRALTNSKKEDPFAGKADIIGGYCETYYINFYTEYYPHTGDVALYMSVNIDVEDIRKDIEEIVEKNCDRVKDGYIQLTDDEKKMIASAVKEYAAEDLEEFFEYENR